MKKLSFLLILAVAVANVLANDGKDRTTQLLLTYLNTDVTVQPETVPFHNFLVQLTEKQRKFKNERDFLSYIFHKTHQKFLKRYESYSSFSELLQNGDYNCLTGTTLYALILNHFNIKHTIIETNYHIFIVAVADGETVLLEATDPINGFVENERDIYKKLATYRENSLQENTKQESKLYQFSFQLWETTSLDELTGLLYFNKAVLAYNSKDLEKSTLFLVQACTHRPSPRIQEFASVVMLTVANSELGIDRKEVLIRQLKTVRRYSEQMLTASVSQ
jgi:hypothetical protein